MHRLRTVTSLDVSAVAGRHAMPAALLFSHLMLFVLRIYPIYTFVWFACSVRSVGRLKDLRVMAILIFFYHTPVKDTYSPCRAAITSS